MDFIAYDWHRIGKYVINGLTVDVKQGNIIIPMGNLCSTFLALCTRRVAGNVDIKLRFGLFAADADTSPNGLNFRNLAALNDSDGPRSIVSTQGAAAPNVVGNENIILPPTITVRTTSPAGADLDFELWFACRAFV